MVNFNSNLRPSTLDFYLSLLDLKILKDKNIEVTNIDQIIS